jgi:hypothetical protein
MPASARSSNWFICAREGLAFGGSLQFDDAPPAGHHHVHVGVAVGVFGVVEVEHGNALDRSPTDTAAT